MAAGEVKQATRRRERARHPARDVHGRSLRHAARGRRRGRHARAAGRRAAGGDREHGAAEERRARLLPLDARRTRSVAVIGPERRGRPHGRRRQLARALEVRGHAARWHHARPLARRCRCATRSASRCRARRRPRTREAPRDEAVALAAKSDVAVVVVGYSWKLESEGFDRPSMDLPAGQDELIQAVAAANKNTVVVVAAGAPVSMTRWLGAGPAVLYAWYGGQEAGHAVGELLFGRANPSGKLPVTLSRTRIEDSTAHGHYPGEKLHVDLRRGPLRRLPRLRQARDRAALPLRLRALVHDASSTATSRSRAPTGAGRARRSRSASTCATAARAPGRRWSQLYVQGRRGEPRPAREGAEGLPPRRAEAGRERRPSPSRSTQSALSFFDPDEERLGRRAGRLPGARRRVVAGHPPPGDVHARRVITLSAQPLVRRALGPRRPARRVPPGPLQLLRRRLARRRSQLRPPSRSPTRTIGRRLR